MTERVSTNVAELLAGPGNPQRSWGIFYDTYEDE